MLHVLKLHSLSWPPGGRLLWLYRSLRTHTHTHKYSHTPSLGLPPRGDDLRVSVVQCSTAFVHGDRQNQHDIPERSCSGSYLCLHALPSSSKEFVCLFVCLFVRITFPTQHLKLLNCYDSTLMSINPRETERWMFSMEMEPWFPH